MSKTESGNKNLLKEIEVEKSDIKAVEESGVQAGDEEISLETKRSMARLILGGFIRKKRLDSYK